MGTKPHKPGQVDSDKLDIHLKHVFEYGVDFANRIIQLIGEIDDDTFAFLDAALTEMESYNRQAVTIKINSPGGSVYAGLAIVGRLQDSKCKIITEGYGSVMSAATLILSCGQYRRLSRYATFMFHESSYNVDGRHSSIRAEVEAMERMEDLWAQWMATLSKKPKKFYKDAAKHTDKYWTPEEVLSYGIVDEVF